MSDPPQVGGSGVAETGKQTGDGSIFVELEQPLLPDARTSRESDGFILEEASSTTVKINSVAFLEIDMYWA